MIDAATQSILHRVIRSIDLQDFSNPELARSFFAAARQNSIPLDSPWWGSREQVIFLQVFSAVLRFEGYDRPTSKRWITLRSVHARDPRIVLSLASDPSRDPAIKKALLYCPGPWSERTTKLIASNAHDDRSLVAACVAVSAKWCLRHHSTLTDVSERVHAFMASRLAVGWFPPSVKEIRRALEHDLDV